MNAFSEFLQSLLLEPLPWIVYDLFFLFSILLRARRGYKRGLIREMSSILCLFGSFFLYKPLAKVIAMIMASYVPMLLVGPISLTIAAFLAYFLLWLIFLIIRISFKLNRKWEGRTKIIVSYGGMTIGILFGSLILIIGWWYILWSGRIGEVLVQSAEIKAEMGYEDVTDNRLLIPSKAMISQREGLKKSIIGGLAEKTNPFPEEFIKAIEVMTSVMRNPAFLEQALQKTIHEKQNPSPTNSSGSTSTNDEEQAGTGNTQLPKPTPSKSPDQEAINKVLEVIPVAEIMEVESFKQLIQDEEIREMAEQSDFNGLMNHPSVHSLLNDPEIMNIMNSVDPDSIMQIWGDMGGPPIEE